MSPSLWCALNTPMQQYREAILHCYRHHCIREALATNNEKWPYDRRQHMTTVKGIWHILAPLSSGFLWLFRHQNTTSEFGEKSQNIFIWYQCTWLGIGIYCASHWVFLPSAPITSAVQHPYSWTTQYEKMGRQDLGRKEKSPWLVSDTESTTIIIEGTKQLVYQKKQ